MSLHTTLSNRLHVSKLALSIAFALPVATAAAQEPDGASDDPVTIEIIEVTANKRTQTLQEVPGSISAISGDMLEARGITNPTDLDKIVPSMINGVGSRGEATVNIRGIGYNEVGSPGVAIHVDGVYQPRPGLGVISQIDVSRVEVLRGPQSTLYGRNANGGVVNYITASPTDQLEGNVSLTLANYEQTQINGTLNIPLSEDWAARISVSHLTRDEGMFDNILSDGPDAGKIDKSLGARLSISGYLSENTRIKLVATSSELDGNPLNTIPTGPSYNPALAGQQVPEGDFEIAVGNDNQVEQNYESLTAVIDWDFDDWVFTSISGYQNYEFLRINDSDFFEINSVINEVIEDSSTFTQEFNLSGKLGDVDSVFGLFYMDDQAAYDTLFYFPEGFGPFPPLDAPTPSLVALAPRYDTTSVALFTDLTWNITDDFRLIGGLRYSDDSQTIVQTSFNVLQPPEVQALCTDVTTEIDTSSTIGRLGMQYDLSKNSNLFGTVSQGVKTGGVNFRSGCQDEYEDEDVTSVEFGYKMSSADQRLVANFTAFFYDYTDLQTQQIVGFNAAIENAPGAEIKGIEIDGVWQPDDYWNITASLSLLDATYTEDFINTNSAIFPNEVINVNGNRLNYAPEVSSNLSVVYFTDPILAEGVMSFRVDINYRSEVTLREFELEGDFNDPTTVVGMSAKWTSESEKYSVRLYGENLTNEAFFEFMNASSANGIRFATWNTPRQYGVEFKVHF